MQYNTTLNKSENLHVYCRFAAIGLSHSLYICHKFLKMSIKFIGSRFRLIILSIAILFLEKFYCSEMDPDFELLNSDEAIIFRDSFKWYRYLRFYIPFVKTIFLLRLTKSYRNT